jgi:hypothetical protein
MSGRDSQADEDFNTSTFEMFHEVSDIRFSGMLHHPVWQIDTDVLEESDAPTSYPEEELVTSITQFRRKELPQCSTVKMEAADISVTCININSVTYTIESMRFIY